MKNEKMTLEVIELLSKEEASDLMNKVSKDKQLSSKVADDLYEIMKQSDAYSIPYIKASNMLLELQEFAEVSNS